MGLVYIISYNFQVSSLGFKTLQQAQEFISNRTGISLKPEDIHFKAEDENGNIYRIHEVSIE